MNIQTCRRCGHQFNFCGCPGKSLECNTCNPTQDAGPRVERSDFDVTSFLPPYKTQSVTQWREVGSNCAHTEEQVKFWRVKIIDLKMSGAMYNLKLTLADVNRMIGNLDSALNTRNYCFPGVSEAEATTVLAMTHGY